ncbi:MAG: sialate O-acetylesterase [Akkermansiaceae bacterium]|nr:sialate O-acetylesterase [Akkermansiaceae bacterium]MCF7732003.1 sialate O-acetylesterase [Akkermansiaceae bacterium]
MKPYHKRFASAAALALLLLTGAEARTWTSADGAKTFEGELRSFDAAAGKVTVTLPNGKSISFMQDKLSAEDIAFVKENASKLPASGPAGKSSLGAITADPKELFKKHDGKPADMSKPVQVFILMGQSNMVGLGNVGTLEEAVKTKSKYPYLIDEGGAWTQRMDVRNVFVMCSGNSPANDQHNDWMSVSNRNRTGPEHGIGHALGNAINAPVMILKSCIGNRSLGWDLLPPGSESYKFKGETQAGYRGTAADPEGKGERAAGEWYAGCQYDGDVAAAKKVLENLAAYYPEGKSYEVAGFFFWQGEKDCGSEAHAERYEKNLIQFIKALRKDFDAPNSKFVLATLGEAKKGEGGTKGEITDAQMAVDGKKNKEFKGNVATVFSNPFCHGGSGNSHYDGNAETYMDVGEAMGQAMAELLKN